MRKEGPHRSREEAVDEDAEERATEETIEDVISNLLSGGGSKARVMRLPPEVLAEVIELREVMKRAPRFFDERTKRAYDQLGQMHCIMNKVKEVGGDPFGMMGPLYGAIDNLLANVCRQLVAALEVPKDKLS